MSELKHGDKVWISGTLEVFEDGFGIRGIEDEPPMIPAVPNLAAVARVLAAHPDGFMALGRVVSNIESDQKGASDFVWDYNDAELGFLRALAAALNGGGE